MTKTILLVNALFLSLPSALCGQEVLIVYCSARGHTAAMAEAVAGAPWLRLHFQDYNLNKKDSIVVDINDSTGVESSTSSSRC